MFPMFTLHVVGIMIGMLVMTICVTIWALLIGRMWRDFRVNNPQVIGCTILSVFLWGVGAAVAGVGAYTITAAILASLIRLVVPM